VTANAERGEISVDLEGVPHVLRPSYEAQVAIERGTGRSIEQLAQAAGDGSLSIEDAAIVVTECVRAQGRATNKTTLVGYTADRVGECIVDAGKLGIVKRVELLLYLAATGGYTAQGEFKAPLKKPIAAEPAGTAG
jgi:hypothetical protein